MTIRFPSEFYEALREEYEAQRRALEENLAAAGYSITWDRVWTDDDE